MIESVVESIRVSLVTNQRVVILKELEGERYLPIWIGPFEAEAIAMELQGVEAARPLPYDIMKTIIGDLGGNVRRILVTTLRDDVFFATIVIEAAGRQVEVDARPSDRPPAWTTKNSHPSAISSTAWTSRTKAKKAKASRRAECNGRKCWVLSAEC
jgi:bifunctional DNase/RNase